jgi:hypothetical protein
MSSNNKNATITLRWSMDYDFFVMTYGKHFPKEKRERIWNQMISNADHTDKKNDEHFWDMEDTDCPENRVEEIIDEMDDDDVPCFGDDEGITTPLPDGLRKKDTEGVWWIAKDDTWSRV